MGNWRTVLSTIRLCTIGPGVVDKNAFAWSCMCDRIESHTRFGNSTMLLSLCNIESRLLILMTFSRYELVWCTSGGMSV